MKTIVFTLQVYDVTVKTSVSMHGKFLYKSHKWLIRRQQIILIISVTLYCPPGSCFC